MPNKESISIDRFYGMPATEGDAKTGSAGYCENSDPALSEGRLGPLPEDVTLPFSPFSAAALYGDDEAIVYNPDSGTFSLLRFASEDETAIGSPPSQSIDVPGMASDGRAVHVGCGPDDIPAWVGKINGSFTVEEAYLRNYAVEIEGTITAGGTSEEGGYFQNGTYFYAISFGYDGGTQESPLVQIQSGGVGPNDLLSLSVEDLADDFGYPYLDVSITIPSGISPRIDFVYLYRAENPRTSSAPFSDWTLFETIEYTGQTLIETDDKGRGGLSFEDRTGFSSELEHMRVRYGLSCVIDSVHVVMDVDFDGNDADRSTTLFFSKPYRYDTFDWSEDFLDLRTKPVALANWSGRLWVFCTGSTFVVNPGLRVEEDRLEGIGAFGPQSVVVTDRGMFWADRQNVYWHNGDRIIPIGEGLKGLRYNPGLSWEHVTTSFNPVVLYNARHDMVTVTAAIRITSGELESLGTVTWGYSVRDGDWRRISLSLPVISLGVLAPVGLMTAGGRAILSTQNAGVLGLFEDTGSFRVVRWESPWLHARGERYVYYAARVEAVGTNTIEYLEDQMDADAEWVPGLSVVAFNPPQFPTYSHTINSNPTAPWTKVRGFRIALAPAFGAATKFSFLQLVRRRIGDAR